MKLLLTSGGVTNASIRSALVGLLGKPIEESTALGIPTAQWGHPMCGPASLRRFVADGTPPTMTGLGWRSVGMLELTALPTIARERWEPWVREADVLLVDGGEATYLAHWMRESGVLDLLPELDDTVWVGVSAGSMVLTPRIGDLFVEWEAAQGDRTLGLVDFSIFPHVGLFPGNTFEIAEEWAAGLGNPAYALDEQSAVVVDGDRVEVVSEGEWRHLGG
ncbi:peptidase E [Nocardioides oleivorans]|uniref:Peptidase E n=1 Tax=Nocardioides oleivorans TaxID=273676 RepID=A0A4Q2S0Q7_9ACTN|nr:Type 1 glutamine amidotransferase-like domain-containing protein [Nocardioides oleivorans]RYB94736.1 peptidase E [Nocardioides oleivorans]